MKNVSISLIVILTALVSVTANANDDGDYFSWLLSIDSKKEVAPVTDKVYQPGFLPERSWEKLMTVKALQNHFKDNAELDEKTRKHILNILVSNSADKSYYKRSKKIMSTLDADVTPIRITEVPYFKDKHHEVAEDIDIKKSKVKSFSNCDKCHQKAEKGIFDDDTVMIPDHGYWTW